MMSAFLLLILLRTAHKFSSISITESRNTTNSSFWDYPCHNHQVVPSSFERTVDHILQPGEYETCDSSYYYHYGYPGYSNGEISSSDWYRFENYENVLTRPPEQLSCGSLYPIWFDGMYKMSEMYIFSQFSYHCTWMYVSWTNELYHVK